MTKHIKAQKDYKVGKGRPPVETQWKPGQSGNPKGRRKGRQNLASIFYEELNQKVAVVENGKRRMISKAQAAIKQLMNSATKGDPKALQAIINLSKAMGDLKPPEHLQEPITRRKRFTLNIFEKNPLTGEETLVEPGTTSKKITE
jgi:hypothetical protein